MRGTEVPKNPTFIPELLTKGPKIIKIMSMGTSALIELNGEHFTIEIFERFVHFCPHD